MINRRIVLAGVLALLLSACNRQEKELAKLEQIKAKTEKTDLLPIITAYSAYLDRYAASEEQLLEAAEYYTQTRYYRLALDCCDRVLEHKATHCKALGLKARILALTGEYKPALALQKRMPSSCPGTAVFEQIEQWEVLNNKADSLTALIRSGQKDGMRYLERARIYASLVPLAALYDMDIAIATQPDSVALLKEAALMALDSKQHDKAKGYAARYAKQQKAADGGAFADFVAYYTESETLLNDLAARMKHEPAKRYELLLERAGIWRKRKEFNRAFADLEEAIAIEPGKANALYARMLLYIETGNKTNAVADYKLLKESGFALSEKIDSLMSH